MGPGSGAPSSLLAPAGEVLLVSAGGSVEIPDLRRQRPRDHHRAVDLPAAADREDMAELESMEALVKSRKSKKRPPEEKK